MIYLMAVLQHFTETPGSNADICHAAWLVRAHFGTMNLGKDEAAMCRGVYEAALANSVLVESAPEATA